MIDTLVLQVRNSHRKQRKMMFEAFAEATRILKARLPKTPTKRNGLDQIPSF